MASEKLKRSGSGEGLPDLEMDMSPMIDLTFLLLIFFMVSSHLITVQIDRRVNPPTALNSQVAKDAAGRVVVNILADGTIWAQDQVELTSTEAITAYVDEARVRFEESGVQTRLNLRADAAVDTRIVKRVVQAAAEAGVVEVIFGSYAVEK
jgi:biopolymer transport protein ExbD